MATLTIQSTPPKSPECGWPPFVAWLNDQGLDPKMIRRVDIAVDGMTMVVHEYALDAEGKRYVVGDELAMADPRQVAIASLPPRR